MRRHWTPIVRFLAIDEGTNALCDAHHLKNDDSIWTLFETVRDYATRDHSPGWTDSRFEMDREDAMDDVRQIIATAKELKTAIADLRYKIDNFERDFRYNPVLMEGVFDVDVGRPSQLFLPEQLQELPRSFHNEQPWLEVDARLTGIISLPVRTNKQRGRIINRTLKHCVEACRTYWLSLNRQWGVDTLDTSILTDKTKRPQLTGDCERFVSDVLIAGGLDHTLADLGTAMRRRRPRSRD